MQTIEQVTKSATGNARDLCARLCEPDKTMVIVVNPLTADPIRLRMGRAWEIGMIANYKVKSGDLTGDMKLGLNMFLKGKLKLVPHSIKGTSEIKAIFSGKGKEYDR